MATMFAKDCIQVAYVGNFTVKLVQHPSSAASINFPYRIHRCSLTSAKAQRQAHRFVRFLDGERERAYDPERWEELVRARVRPLGGGGDLEPGVLERALRRGAGDLES